MNLQQILPITEFIDIRDDLRKPINSSDRQNRIAGKEEADLYPYYGATGQVGWIDNYITDGEYVLIGEDGAPFFDHSKEKAYLIQGKTWVNNHAHVLKAKPGKSINAFIRYYLNFFNYNGFVNGTTRLKLTKGSLQQIPVPCFGLEQQKQIVYKIDRLFSEIDSGVEELKRVQKNLELYKQSVLNAAVRGKLVPQDPNDETASVLLAKIRAEKDKLIKAGKLRKEKPLPPIDPSEIPFELPQGWEWVRLGDIYLVYVGSTPSREKTEYWGGGINWVSSGEVSYTEISNTKETISEFGLENSSCVVHPPNTVMMGMIGEGKTRGQAAILKIHAAHNQNTAAIRTDHTPCSYDYLYLYLVANYERNRKIGSGNNQKALNKELIREFIFPLPPINEQKKIANKVIKNMRNIQDISDDIENRAIQIKFLKQSILKSAFEGKLV